MTWLRAHWKPLTTTLGAILFVVLAFAYGNKPDTPARPGEASVYQRIDSSRDCAGLQGEFDQADANRKTALARNNQSLAETSLSYMEAAEARMRALGC